MAHWIAVVSNQHVSAHETKTKAVRQVGLVLATQSASYANRIVSQLQQSTGASVAYGNDEQEIAKVLPCNCGSVKQHSN